MMLYELDEIEKAVLMGNPETVNDPDPEALIEQMIHEVAYERVKHSYLFNALHNDAIDRKADELAAKIGALVEQWISAEVDDASEEHTPDEGEPHPAFECESRGCVKLRS